MKALEFATKVMGRLPAMVAKKQDVQGFVNWANDLLIKAQKEQRDLTPNEEAELNEHTNIAQGRADGASEKAYPNDGTLPDKGVDEPPRYTGAADNESNTRLERGEQRDRDAAAEAERLRNT